MRQRVAWIQCQDDGQGRTTGKTIDAGLLQGTVEGVLTPAPPKEGDTVIVFKEVVTFTSEYGSLTVEVQGAIDVTTGKFNASGPVKDAKGKLAGATGHIALIGIVDLTNGVFIEDVSGVVCMDSAQ